MSQNSSPYSSDSESHELSIPPTSANSRNVSAAPMPSLTSHPPLRLQRKPVVGTILKGLSSSLPTPTPSLLPSLPTSPLPPRRNTPSAPPSDDEAFSCPYCSATFKKVGHLNRHTLKHTGIRFNCEIPGCDKTFSRLDNMRTHMKNMHSQANASGTSEQQPRSSTSSQRNEGDRRPQSRSPVNSEEQRRVRN